MARFKKSLEQVREESDRAREMVVDVLRRKGASFIWSYETFMFLGKDYFHGYQPCRYANGHCFWHYCPALAFS